MFRSHSDHLQGARIFLIKVTDFKILKSVTLIRSIRARKWRAENVAQLRAHIVKLCRALSEDLCRKVVTNARGSFARGCEAKRWSH